jgi:hypothetical protein
MLPVYSYFRYVTSILCALGGFLIIGFVFPSTKFYYQHSPYAFDVVDEIKFTIKDVDSDILFIGDSSLLFGVIPQIVMSETGLSAYNLGVPFRAYFYASSLLLENYLRNNKRPRLIVLYMSPRWHMDNSYPFGADAWYDGGTMNIRHGGVSGVERFFIGKPERIVEFSYLVWKNVIRFDWSGDRSRELTASLAVKRGHASAEAIMGRAVPPVLNDCKGTVENLEADTAYIESFRAKYSRLGIAVAVYVAPLPDCPGTLTRLTTAYRGIVDNTPYVLPHQWFLDDPEQVHLLSSGAKYNSALVARFIGKFTKPAATQ